MLYSGIRTTFCRNLLVRYKRVFSLKSSGTELNILKQISDPKYADKIAIVDSKSSITYAELDDLSTKLAASIQSQLPSNCNTIAGHNCPNKNYVISMFAAWKLGQRFLPLCPSHPKHELEYFLKDSGSGMILYSAASSIDVEIISKTDNLIASLGLPSINVNNLTKNINKSTNNNTVNASIDKTSSNTAFPSASSGGLILYTSGTTGAPKGVLHPNDNINHWIKSLTQAWQYTESDRILHFLPLHHLHGVLNKLLCVLSVGGTVDFVSKANASFLWKKLGREGKLSIDNNHKPVTLFMAVPTIYVKMVEEARKCAEVYGLKFDDLKNTLLNTDDESLLKLMTAYESKRPPSSDTISLLDLKYALRCIDDMRLMVSGSAALPEMTFKDWKTLTGHELLERYGMTEIGMALSNPYDGNYKLGTVGRPLPFVDCRIIDEQGGVVTAADSPGELRIKGKNVFECYLNKPDATKETFDDDGWFKTGDIVSVDSDGYYKILGRNSVDIIKSAGYKLSALEIETEILSHPKVAEVAVFGTKDDTLGESVVAIVAVKSMGAAESTIDPESFILELKQHLKSRLATYKQPRIYKLIESIPRNHMGKVNKKSLKKDLGF